MEISELIPHIEALIFASDKPLTAMEITELLNNAFGFMDDKLTLDQIPTGIEGIVAKYNSDFYPFEVRESGGGWQFLSKKSFSQNDCPVKWRQISETPFCSCTGNPGNSGI